MKKNINPLSLSLQLFNYKKYVKFNKIYHQNGIKRICLWVVISILDLLEE